MTDPDPIPRSYQQWRECITVRCGIALTKTYIASRLVELRDPSHPKTHEFCGKYGQAYLTQIVQWFETAQKES
jgi:hypothetical protein